MQDELLLRQWNAGHSQFSTDLDRWIHQLGSRMAAHARRGLTIGSTYALPDRGRDPALGSATSTLLAGLAAVATTLVLFAAAAILAVPGSAQGSSHDASAATTVGYALA